MIWAAPSGLRFCLTVDHRTNDRSSVCGICKACNISTHCEPLYPKCNHISSNKSMNMTPSSPIHRWQRHFVDFTGSGHCRTTCVWTLILSSHIHSDTIVHPLICSTTKDYRQLFSRELNCLSLRCRRCSNYIPYLHLTRGFNILHIDNCKPRRETFKFWNLLHLILEILQYLLYSRYPSHRVHRISAEITHPSVPADVDKAQSTTGGVT